MDDTFRYADMMSQVTGQGLDQFLQMDQASFENMIETQLIPAMQQAGMSRDEINSARQNFQMMYQVYQDQRDSGSGGDDEG